MRTVEQKQATQALAEYAADIQAGPLVVTDKGRPVAVLMSVEGADLESVALSLNPKFIALIERSRAQCPPGAGISSDEMRRRLGIPKKAPRKRSAKVRASKK